MSNQKVERNPPPGNEKELYAKHQKVYPREVHGIFAMLRTLGVLVLLGIYYGVPWINWGDRQAVLFDLPGRKFHVLGLTFWPQDFFLLAVLLIIAALSLFFFTALAGRLWCGYACPQTVWTEVFLWFERKFEGDRPKQIKLDKAGWTGEKLLRKGGKHAAWIIFSLYTGLTFVGYFSPIRELVPAFFGFQTSGWETFWILFYGFATWGNAGFLREQVCIYMCPYARFQSAMFDRDTLIIAYDEKRGEPRGSRKRGVDYKEQGLGDCVDCTLCVQVCPTGIDIRNGLQYQCIGCAACIDVCDEVMEKMGYPKGLVRYTTQHAMDGRPTKILRPRMFVYTGVLLVLLIGLAIGISQRTLVGIDVIRDRNTLYREVNGLIENVYILKLVNKDSITHRFEVSIDGLPGAELLVDATGDIEVPSGGVLEVPARVRVDGSALPGASADVQFTLESVDVPGLSYTRTGRFVGPFN